MRTLTPAMVQAMTGQETTEVFVVLVTFEHEDLLVPARFSSDPAERVSSTPLVYRTVSRGDDYVFVPMEVSLPDDVDGGTAQAKLRVSNVGRDLIAQLRSISTPAQVTIELVLASDPDTVGFTLPVLDMVAAGWDKDSVDLSLTVEALDAEPYPAGNFDQTSFPALF